MQEVPSAEVEIETPCEGGFPRYRERPERTSHQECQERLSAGSNFVGDAGHVTGAVGRRVLWPSSYSYGNWYFGQCTDVASMRAVTRAAYATAKSIKLV